MSVVWSVLEEKSRVGCVPFAVLVMAMWHIHDTVRIGEVAYLCDNCVQ